MGVCKDPIDDPPLSIDQTRKKRSRLVDSEIDKDSNDACYPKKKRVKFATAANGSVKVTKVASDICRSDLDKGKLWWSRRDRAIILNRCQASIKGFRGDHMDQVRHYLCVFEKCSESPSQSSSDYIEKATVSLPIHARGLEWGIAPSTKTQRRAHVRAVIDVQDQIQGLSATMRDRVMSTRSLRSSRPCRVMARLLGDGDAKQSQEESKCKNRRSHCTMLPGW
jgi:hypothetical protein